MSKTKEQTRFMDLYTPHHEAFVRFCTAKAYRVMEVEDLVNDSILAVFQKLDHLKNDQAFLSYLFSTASNILKNEIRRKKIIFFQPDYQHISDKTFILAEDEKPDIAVLYQALNQLPENQKEAIILYEISGYKIKEIAALHHTSEELIRQRLSRGRKKLAELLHIPEIQQANKQPLSRVLTSFFV
ncbi:MAG: sigma-70 family RNA polymerase sigma factor [Bacteroidales bacterium]|nr:sigma-70 family RNA polymerase sigma factor [Bacteroidales bacterium]